MNTAIASEREIDREKKRERRERRERERERERACSAMCQLSDAGDRSIG